MPPTSASLVGNSTMPDPNILTAVNIVSCPTLIFFATDMSFASVSEKRSFSYSKESRLDKLIRPDSFKGLVFEQNV